jgi:cytochrome b subunit of formate dehydrogenase
MEVAIPLEAEAAVPARMQYRRFSAFQRWVHFFVMFSFTILVFTGMPLKYSDQGWARWAMGLYGGVQMAGIIHRFAALISAHRHHGAGAQRSR